jgi:glutaredoxin
MKRTALPKVLTLLTLLLAAGAASAQVYRWVDANGVKHYSDQPPPPSTPASIKVEVKSYSSGSSISDLPAELAEVVRNRPVTLYTTGQCEGCNQARAMLLARGVPFSEKTVTTAEDQAVLKKAGSNGQLPLLLVGRSKQIGYEQGSWEVLLSDAGYPARKILPAGYSNPAPVAAAPPPPPDPAAQARAAAQAAQEEQQRLQRPPAVNAPPGFQF